MATVTKRFSFPADAEGWTWNAGGGTGFGSAWSNQDNSPNDPDATLGVLAGIRTGRSLATGTPYWEWSGTWEDLGVPVGATVTAVKLDYDWFCRVYTTGASSTSGPAELRNGAGTTLRGTFSTSVAATAITAWASRAGTTLSGLSEPETTAIRLRLGNKPNTGNNTSAAVWIVQDNVLVTVTYSVPGTPITDSDAIALSEGATLSITLSTSEAVAHSDASASVSGSMAAADTASLADAATIATQLALAVTDALGLTETATASQQSAFSASDTLGHAELTTVVSSTLNTQDFFTFGDAVSALSLTLATSDALTHTEISTLQLALAVADALAQSETGTVQNSFSVSDATVSADTSALTAQPADSDTQTQSDASAVSATANASDSAAASEAAFSGQTASFAAGDTLTQSDSASLTTATILVVTEALTQVEALGSLSVAAVASDTALLSEAANLAQAILLAASDAQTQTEAQAAINNALAASELLAQSDVIALQQALITTSEAGAFADVASLATYAAQKAVAAYFNNALLSARVEDASGDFVLTASTATSAVLAPVSSDKAVLVAAVADAKVP